VKLRWTENENIGGDEKDLLGRRSRKVLRETNNVFLLTLAALSFGSVISLAALGEAIFTVYLALLAIVYFATTLVFRVKRRPSFDFLAVVLAIVFVWSIVSYII
jgi:hypothetical protein